MKQLTLNRESLFRGSLILVNKTHLFRETALPPLIPVREGSGQLLERRAASLLQSLMEEIGGWRHITPISGWRSKKEQREIWEESLRDKGEEFTRRFVALPGCSEHETGLAIDLGFRKSLLDYLCPDFPRRGVCQTFRERAADFGFIERYPAGKEAVTGISHEPWHFRYVGAPHAAIMRELSLTLEEYTEFIKNYPPEHPYLRREKNLLLAVSYIPAAPEGATKIRLEERYPHSLSGNNGDGFILTEWRRTHADTKELRRA